MKWLEVCRSDFDRLLSQFRSCETVRFEQFSEVWKRMKMSYIMSGLEMSYEMRQFIEDCLTLALEYCSAEKEFQDRIGGLYILYSFYYKQPLEPPARIRISPSQWNELKVLLEEIKGQQHLDAEYIFNKLRVDKAFQLVAYPTRVMLSNYSHKEGEEGNQEAEKPVRQNQEGSILGDIMEPDTISQLSALHEQYHQMKCYLSGGGSSKPEESLSCIKNNLVQNITKSVASFEEYRRQKFDPKKARGRRRKDSATTTTSESEGDSDFDAWRPTKKKVSKHGEIRASLKEKAFRMPVGNRYSVLKRRKKMMPDNAKNDNVSDSGADESDTFLSPDTLLSPVQKQSDTDDDYIPSYEVRKSIAKNIEAQDLSTDDNESSQAESPLKSPPVRSSLRHSPVKGSPIKHSPAKGSPVEDSSVEGSSTGGSPVKRSPIKRSPLKRSPVKGSPVKRSPQGSPRKPFRRGGARVRGVGVKTRGLVRRRGGISDP